MGGFIKKDFSLSPGLQYSGSIGVLIISAARRCRGLLALVVPVLLCALAIPVFVAPHWGPTLCSAGAIAPGFLGSSPCGAPGCEDGAFGFVWSVPRQGRVCSPPQPGSFPLLPGMDQELTPNFPRFPNPTNKPGGCCSPRPPCPAADIEFQPRFRSLWAV